MKQASLMRDIQNKQDFSAVQKSQAQKWNELQKQQVSTRALDT